MIQAVIPKGEREVLDRTQQIHRPSLLNKQTSVHELPNWRKAYPELTVRPIVPEVVFHAYT